MALEHPRLLAASLTAAILGTSCSTPSDSSTQPAPDDQAGTQRTNSGAAAQGQEPQGSEQRVAAERRQALVAAYVERAEALRANGQLLAAKSELLKARDQAPTNEQVFRLLSAVQAELGEPTGRVTTFADEQLRLQKIGEERARADVTAKLQRADGLLAEKNYAGAIEELRLAALTIDLKDQVDWMGRREEVAAKKNEAEKRFAEQQRAEQAAENKRLADRLRQEYEAAAVRRRVQVDTLLLESQHAFVNRRFAYAQDCARRALEIDPNSTVAAEMVSASVKASRESSTDAYYLERAKAIRNMIEADEAMKVPQTAVLEMDPTTWETALKRSDRKNAANAMAPEDQHLLDTTKTLPVGRLTYTEETGSFLDVVNNLKLSTGQQILVTPEARKIIEEESLKVQIEVKSAMSLFNFLEFLCGRSTKLAWTVRHGVVLIGDKSQAAGTLSVELYPVKDLVMKHKQFIAPKIRDIPGESNNNTDDSPRFGGEAEDPIVFVELADLKKHVEDATNPKYWADADANGGCQIGTEDSGFLVVKANPDMQKQVQQILQDMRRFATPVVTIDSKFLTISRNFLQEVGVDFRGLGGAGNKGSVATLDDITNGLQNNASRGLDNGGTGDPAANPLAGAFFNDGGDGDVRGRTENFFGTDLSRVLTPTGGFTGAWTLIGDTQLNMILRAVEKQQDVEVVNSQILSVTNNQRGHVAVINQTTYVRDFDVEVAQAAFIADPKIDIIQDGIVLDVEPTIQHDRKYIILNLNPTVSELTRPIPTFTTSLAGSTLPVTLQLPRLTVTNFSTTVKVPDGGTVLLGGLRQTLNKERRAEVPVLSRLPILSFFFKQEGSADENRNLMVMVRAQITDVIEKIGK
jgi:type II secretory pathway component GspD/PulD (secretin)